MKTLFLIVITFIICQFSTGISAAKNTTSRIDTTLISFKNKKEVIDEYLKTHQKEIVVLAKVSSKKKLVRVLNNKWPDNVEYSYNILKDKSGKIIFIMQSPFSESGDWDIEYHHYFDENGNTYAFSCEESVFEDDVKGGVIRKLLLKYYDHNFHVVGTINKIMDVNFKPIEIKKAQYDFRNYKYSIYKNLNDCLAGYNIEKD